MGVLNSWMPTVEGGRKHIAVVKDLINDLVPNEATRISWAPDCLPLRAIPQQHGTEFEGDSGNDCGVSAILYGALIAFGCELTEGAFNQHQIDAV